MEELPKTFEPQTIEKKWYCYWEENNFFKADPKSNKAPFCIVMPPPNVTGVLHMGHALVNTIQDILIRYKRMKGFEALWVPGTDHAGIATQTTVERHLMSKMGKRRKDFSREEFLNHIWQWKQEHQNHIINQIKQLGCSCDWSRLRFTMDEKSNRCVRKVFKKMYEDKIIYQGDYLVNWDPLTQTALADDEVEYETRKSKIWYFRYPIEGQKNYLIIATTRPETMLGDTAVAVHPKDSRFISLIGHNVILPITNRSIPIIEDHYVDPAFGSGAVKITPAHDPNDFEIGNRHQLQMINIMTKDGKLNENVPKEFQGLSMINARAKIVDKMKELDLIEKIEPYELRVGVSYRSKAIIEPYLSKQWFVKTTAFKDQLTQAIKTQKVKIIPKEWENTYFHWIENLRDWCISRQLWWGHRIPIWYYKNDNTKIICHDGEDLPDIVQQNPNDWYQDEDVLDTWFSSGTWPFSVLGWPDNTDDLKKFYPTSVLVTAHDILFFWVARMILMSEYVFNDIPFSTTFLHGLIYGKSYWRVNQEHIQYIPYKEKKLYDLGKIPPQDVFSKWEKMSKSKGNVIDPIDLIQEYGTDATRMALTSITTYAKQIDLDRRKFEDFKNFANKIWNGARFIFLNLKENIEKKLPALTDKSFVNGLNFDLLTLEDKWLFSILNKNIEKINAYLETFQFDKAAHVAYEFYWKEFCSYYLELTKPILFGNYGTLKLRENKQKILVITLLIAIRLLHPIAPFITEELFQKIKSYLPINLSTELTDAYTNDAISSLKSTACINAPFPEIINKEHINTEIEEEFENMKNIIYAIRNIRSEMNVPLSSTVDVIFSSKNKSTLNHLQNNFEMIKAMVKVDNIHYLTDSIKDKFGSSAIVKDLLIYIPMPNSLKEKEKVRLTKEIEKLTKQKESTESKLNNQTFLEKAPDHIILKMKNTLQETSQAIDEILYKLKSIEKS
jgi:valyl-tRNA synthetase